MARREFPDFSKKSISSSLFFRKLPTLAGNMALNFFNDSWRRRGFIDTGIERWPKRKGKATKSNRALLVKTGRLRRSLRTQTNGSIVRIYTEVPYAKAHNEGANIKGVVTVRDHTRRTKKGNRITVRSHSRKLNIRIPKRQFMGHSDLLERRMILHVSKALDQIF